MDSSPTPSPNTGTRRAWPIYKEVGADVVGDVFDGRYQIVRRLAKGGMADVFLAKDRTAPSLTEPTVASADPATASKVTWERPPLLDRLVTRLSTRGALTRLAESASPVPSGA